MGSFRTASEGADIMFPYGDVNIGSLTIVPPRVYELTIAACSDILETISLAILPLNHLPDIFSAVLRFGILKDSLHGIAPGNTPTPDTAKVPADPA